MLNTITPKHTTRWREHEFLLVTLVCILAITGSCWRLLQHSTFELIDRYGHNFLDNHLPFNYTKNILLPEITLPLLIYCCYIWMTLFILPRLMQTATRTPNSFRLNFNLHGGIEISGTAGEALKKFGWGLLHTFLLLICLGTGWGIIYFYSHQYDLPRDISNINIMGRGLRMATNYVVLFIAYTIFREAILRRLETRESEHASSIDFLNKITAFVVCYFVFGALLVSIELFDRDFSILYFGFVPPVVLTALTNIYWLLPRNPEAKFFNKNILWRIALATLLWGIPFMIAMVPNKDAVVPVILSLWIAQMFVTYPISWLIFRNQKEKIMRIRGLETELGQSKADLQFLRSQINPHFLFNVLNTLYGTALHENAGKTAGGIQQLGDMMRFMLHENNLDRIAMSKEIDYIKGYITLQQLRTEASPMIMIETGIDEEIPPCEIAPMLIIPFVENSFKHGISLREPSWIKLDIHCDGARVHMELRNSIHKRQGTDPEAGRSGVGLKNVLHRLKLIYPDKHEFFLHQDEREFFVQLTIQL